MEKEFNLSEKIKGFGINRQKVKRGWIYEEDIKEFIKIIKQDFFDWVETLEDRNIVEMIINKRAGDKLI